MSNIPRFLSDVDWETANTFTWRNLSETRWGRVGFDAYLIQDNNILYTISNNALVVVDSDLSAQTFRNYGFYTFPNKQTLQTLLFTLTRPKILYYNNIEDDVLPNFKAVVNGKPFTQDIYADTVYTLDPSILGIEKVKVWSTGQPLIAISFNGGAYEVFSGGWKTCEEHEGMTPSQIEALTEGDWYLKIKDKPSMKVRIVITNLIDTFTKMIFTYINNSGDEEEASIND